MLDSESPSDHSTLGKLVAPTEEVKLRFDECVRTH
jgi:hypothetical protein